MDSIAEFLGLTFALLASLLVVWELLCNEVHGTVIDAFLIVGAFPA